MAVAREFTEQDMEIDLTLGFPSAYAKLCRDPSFSPYIHGPPFTFSPYSLHFQQALRAKELDEMFPITDPKAKPTTNPRIYATLLWKQLNHLGNAGFDPAKFRVDSYGNVLYFDADSSSPLAWDIDHWFPCSRGGLTVPSNLRIMHWQVCERKKNRLEFLVPWWDLQLGISTNQFLAIFASSYSDFRHRAFRWFFSEGENEELDEFMESKDNLGLAPASIVRARRDSRDPSLATLGSLDINRQSRPSTPFIASIRKLKNGATKENERPEMVNTNPYESIVMARDSLKQREEANKMKTEIQKLDDEVDELRLKNDEEKVTIQELELALIERRRKAERCRRLAETQSSYKAMLQNMIRNAMHQTVVYKEQVRQYQAATITLMARLEEKKAICSSAEKELHKRFKQRDDLEKELQPEEEEDKKRLPKTIETRARLHKELRRFLEEEDAEERENAREREIVEEDEESRKAIGKGNVEKWLKLLLEEDADDLSPVSITMDTETSKTDKIINDEYPRKEIQVHLDEFNGKGEDRGNKRFRSYRGIPSFVDSFIVD